MTLPCSASVGAAFFSGASTAAAGASAAAAPVVIVSTIATAATIGMSPRVNRGDRVVERILVEESSLLPPRK